MWSDILTRSNTLDQARFLSTQQCVFGFYKSREFPDSLSNYQFSVVSSCVIVSIAPLFRVSKAQTFSLASFFQKLKLITCLCRSNFRMGKTHERTDVQTGHCFS